MSSVGGQAVLEGVMMRDASTWAVAVRRPDGEVAVETHPVVSVLARHRLLRLPVVRGAVGLVESLRLGLRALAISVGAQATGDDDAMSGATWAGAVAAGLGLAVGLFFLLPAALTSLSGLGSDSGLVFVAVEKGVRLTVFVAYLWLVSRLPHLQRLFAYHGAEHKAIACHEAGLALTPVHAAPMSRLHPRCGTSFLLIVMVISVVVFAPLGSPWWPVLLASRIVGIPLVAGLAYETIRWMGAHSGQPVARVLIWPGLQLQRLTTREPDAAQLAVAIAALQAVLDDEQDHAERGEHDAGALHAA